MECATIDTITYIKRMAQDMAGLNLNCAVLAFMFDLKMPVNLHGFEYLKAAILMRYENPTMDLTNEIYALIASAQVNVSSDVIAASIRRAIKSSFDYNEIAKWQLYLPAVIVTEDRPPTNAEVIAGLARILELWQGCASAYIYQRHKEVVSCGRK